MTTKKVSLKIGAPSKKDFDAIYRFRNIIDTLTDSRFYGTTDPSSWKEWDETDKDYKLLKKIEKEICEYYDESPDEIDQRVVLWEFVRYFFQHYGGSINRVIMCADMAMENAFDKKTDVIEWNKKLLKIVDKADKYDNLKKNKT